MPTKTKRSTKESETNDSEPTPAEMELGGDPPGGAADNARDDESPNSPKPDQGDGSTSPRPDR
jgi:hypothetical protein